MHSQAFTLTDMRAHTHAHAHPEPACNTHTVSVHCATPRASMHPQSFWNSCFFMRPAPAWARSPGAPSCSFLLVCTAPHRMPAHLMPAASAVSVCLHVRAHALCLPLTTPPSASTAALPPPSHTIVDIDACRTQCEGRAVCCEGLPCRKGRGRSDRRQ